MSAELSTESEVQRTNADSKPSHSAVKIFKVKRHRDDAPSETISKGGGVDGASKKKRTNRDTPESVAVQLEAFSLTHKARVNNSGREGVLKRIATMKKLKKKDEAHLVVHSLKSKFKNKRRHKRRSKRIGLVSKISKTTHSNKRDTRSKQRHKQCIQFGLVSRGSSLKETPNPPEKHNTTDQHNVPSHRELIIDIYHSATDKKERRYWRRRYPYLREEDPSNNSDSEYEDEETDTDGENEEDEDDDYVYDYYIDGQHYIQEMIASGFQIVEVDFDEIEPECEEYLGNDYPEDESDSPKDYFSMTDDEDPDDSVPFY